MDIDYERLRQDLINIDMMNFVALDYYPSFIYGIDLQTASYEELEDYAYYCGCNLDKYRE